MSETPKPAGVMKQPQGDLYAARIKLVAGHVTAAQLRVLADVCERYGNGAVHLTTRQGVEIHDIHDADTEAAAELLATAGLHYGGSGKRVRTIVACPGLRCRCGVIDAQGLAFRMDERLRQYEGLPGKFKVAISGCPNGCAKPQATCLGVMGRQCGGADGQPHPCYVIFVGGKMGRKPKLAEQLPVEINDDDLVVDVAASTVEWYRDQGEGNERFADLLERVGIDALMEWLTATTGLRARC